MTLAPKQMKLGAMLFSGGHHVAAWRHPSSAANGSRDFAHYKALARTAERGLFDLLFLADVLTSHSENPDARRMSSVTRFEPFSLLSALAAVTDEIGLVCTSTTTYDEPYLIARRFASLDQISGGRAGWNLITSAHASEAGNFGREEHLPHAARYRRAQEFVDVVRGLWDSWEDDAFVLDKEQGLFFDPAKLHQLNHAGEFFRVRGPLNVGRSPQGQPVLVQAGSSDDGKDLAARTAEVVFTAQRDLKGAQAFYKDVKGRMEAYGRRPDTLKIMPGVFPVVARTEQEAQDKYGELQELIHPDVGRALLSTFLGFDLSSYPIDGPLPDLPEKVLEVSRAALLNDLARKDNLTIRELYLRVAGARGHWQIVGSVAQIADALEEWFRAGAADGFNYMPPVLPTSLDEFVELVIPELQRRGLFRTGYEGRTLREKLGLPRPFNRFGTRAAAQP